jgi:hypothetical protein
MRIGLSEMLRRRLRWPTTAAKPANHVRTDPNACRCYGCSSRYRLEREGASEPVASRRIGRVTFIASGNRAS